VMHGVAGVIAVDLDELAYATEPATVFSFSKKAGGLIGPILKKKGVAQKDATAASLLPAHTARRVDGKIAPAELLLLDAAGIELTLTKNVNETG
ncbi:MAG: hypothetical protein WAU00_15075, partial [Caldilinea sp.]